MMVRVYRLRDKGEKLDRAAVRETAVQGVLRFGRHVVVPEWEARLFSPGGRELAMLRCAQIMRIERGGILIRGSITEFDDAGQHHYMQAWWCVPALGVDNDEHIKEPRDARGGAL